MRNSAVWMEDKSVQIHQQQVMSRMPINVCQNLLGSSPDSPLTARVCGNGALNESLGPSCSASSENDEEFIRDFADDLSLFAESIESSVYEQQNVLNRTFVTQNSNLDFTHVSLQTLLGSCEILGHTCESRVSIASAQSIQLVTAIQAGSTKPLRHPSQKQLFIVAPLDVLVTRDPISGHNKFHIIEINGTGIAGITNMPTTVVNTLLRSISEVPEALVDIPNPIILVASSGMESNPPVSRTMHEKILYCEALKRGFEATGRNSTITNMTRLEREGPISMSKEGPVIVLGYMRQFRRNFKLSDNGQLLLFGRQVSGLINDRFILNIVHQFKHTMDLKSVKAYNAGFFAGADKGIAYSLYNEFAAHNPSPVMAACVKFQRANTRDELVAVVASWLAAGQVCVIKPQGTGCGHGIEFFLNLNETLEEIEAKVDAALFTVASTYDLECGGLPFTVSEFLDTAVVSSSGAAGHVLRGHKFELRIVVYRSGEELLAYPSIAKVARSAFDPAAPDKSSLINNITTSAKDSSKSGSEFMLPLSNARTLGLLGISLPELTELSSYCTSFVRYVIDQVQDNPSQLGLAS